MHKIFWHTVPPRIEAPNEVCNFLGALHPRHQLVFDIKVYGFCHAMLFRLSWYSCMSCKKKLQCTAFFEITPKLTMESTSSQLQFVHQTHVFMVSSQGKLELGCILNCRLYCAPWKPTFFCLLSFEATDSFWNKVVSLQPNQAKRNQLSEESHRQHQTVIVFHVQVIQVLFQCTVQIQFLCTCKLLKILKPLILVEIWLAYWKIMQPCNTTF